MTIFKLSAVSANTATFVSLPNGVSFTALKAATNSLIARDVYHGNNPVGKVLGMQGHADQQLVMLDMSISDDGARRMLGDGVLNGIVVQDGQLRLTDRLDAGSTFQFVRSDKSVMVKRFMTQDQREAFYANEENRDSLRKSLPAGHREASAQMRVPRFCDTPAFFDHVPMRSR